MDLLQLGVVVLVTQRAIGLPVSGSNDRVRKGADDCGLTCVAYPTS